jgi:CubicO group peptidase (beta-lactamase class C family)
VINAGLTAAATVGLPRPAISESPSTPDLHRLIDAERRTILGSMSRDDIPGVAVCLVHDGKPVWIEGFGVTDRRSKRPVSTDTIFSIQSTSKNVAATAIMIAVQHSLLDLDVPITTYLPDFTVHSRFESAPQKKITLRLLLSHRAGFTHEAPVGNNYDPEFPDFAAHVRSISQTWLRYPVGERYRYSNLGFDLAGYILQVRSGMPFAKWVKATVFDPLGMTDSTVATEVYATRKNRALGHEKGYATVPLRIPLIPSGGVYTSARDMAAYILFHLNRGSVKGRALLREDLWNEMHGFCLGADYGLGVVRGEERYGDTTFRLFNHFGGGFGFGSVFYYCPKAGLGWLALFNRPADAAYQFGTKLVEGALAARYGAHKPRLPVSDMAPIALSDAQLQSFAGRYLGRGFTAEISVEKGALKIRADSKTAPELLLQFTAPDEAFVPDADGDAVTYRWYAARKDEPAHFECWIVEEGLDYNEGPHDPLGPDRPGWSAYVGQYRIYQWGKPADRVTIHRKNGWLWLNNIRLIAEFEPGLFFTSDGEAVDFRDRMSTWRNIRLRRMG